MEHQSKALSVTQIHALSHCHPSMPHPQLLYSPQGHRIQIGTNIKRKYDANLRKLSLARKQF